MPEIRRNGVIMKRNIALLLVFALCFSFAATACQHKRSPENAKYYYDGIEDLSKYINLPDYENLTLDVAPEPSEEEVESYIANSLSANKGMNKITDRAIAEKDTVAITFVGSIDGKEDKNCTYKDTEKLYECTVGSGRHIKGFEEGLIGVMPGETVTLNLTFPTDYGNKDYAGKPVTFVITTYEIREYYTPELTDEFVKSLEITEGDTKVETVAAYREYAKAAVKDATTSKIMKNPDVYKWQLVAEKAEIKEYPQEQIDDYLKDNTDYFKGLAEQYGVGFADYLANYGMTEESFNEMMTDNAKTYIRDCFVAEKIARDHNISFTEDEYKEMLEDLAVEQKAESGQELVDKYGDDFMRMYFVTEKAMEYIGDTVKEVNVPEEQKTEEKSEE